MFHGTTPVGAVNLTRESEYALRGLVRLATYPRNAFVPHSDIAKLESLPAAFLAKIFQKLARHGVLRVERGRGRGYALKNPPGLIQITDIFEAIEGPSALTRCLLWGGHCCETTPCPLHRRLEPLRQELDARLSTITLADFANRSGEVTSPNDAGVTR